MKLSHFLRISPASDVKLSHFLRDGQFRQKSSLFRQKSGQFRQKSDLPANCGKNPVYFGRSGEHDCYKRLGDFLLRNDFGTTRPFGKSPKLNERETQRKNEQTFTIIVPLIPKDMFRLVCLVKLVFFAREGVAF